MSLKNKNVFITGITGFVGSHLAKHLLNEGANVFGPHSKSNRVANAEGFGKVRKVNW